MVQTYGIDNYGNGDLSEFKKYLKVDLRLKHNTAQIYICYIRKYLSSNQFNQSDLRDFLSTIDNPNTYNNYLKSFIAYSRFTGIDIQFKFTKIEPILRVLPTKKELNEFYNALDLDYERLLFLGYCCTGLRRTELLNIRMNDVDLSNHAILPNHATTTKRSYLTFYNDEFNDQLQKWSKLRYPKSDRLFSISGSAKSCIFNIANKITGMQITPQVLRFWFTNELAHLGVPDRFIDAFQGRIPRSVLARHYTDYSLDNLKAIYDKANLKILS